MTALTPPAMDAPAEQWGELATQIPGWRSPRLPWWAIDNALAGGEG